MGPQYPALLNNPKRKNRATFLLEKIAITSAFLWIAVTAASSPSAAQQQNPLASGMTLRLSCDVISAFTFPEIHLRKQLQETIEGAQIIGDSFTTGKMQVTCGQSGNAATIRLILDSITVLQGHATKPVTNNLKTEFDAYATVNARTEKYIFIKTDGIQYAPARTFASATLQFDNVEALAIGPLAGVAAKLTAGAVANKLENSKQEQAAHLAEKIAAELSRQLDQQAQPLLNNLDTKFRAMFFDSLIAAQRLPGASYFQSTIDALWLNVLIPQASGLQRDPLVSGNRGALSLHISEAVVNHIFASYFGDTSFTGEHLKEMLQLLNSKISRHPPNITDTDTDYQFTLQNHEPIKTIFQDDSATLIFQFARVTFKGRDISPVAIGIRLSRISSGSSTSSPSLASAGNHAIAFQDLYVSSLHDHAVDSDLHRYIDKELRPLVPSRLDLPKIQLPQELSQLGQIEMSHLTSTQGWLFVEFSLLKNISAGLQK